MARGEGGPLSRPFEPSRVSCAADTVDGASAGDTGDKRRCCERRARDDGANCYDTEHIQSTVLTSLCLSQYGMAIALSQVGVTPMRENTQSTVRIINMDNRADLREYLCGAPSPSPCLSCLGKSEEAAVALGLNVEMVEDECPPRFNPDCPECVAEWRAALVENLAMLDRYSKPPRNHRKAR